MAEEARPFGNPGPAGLMVLAFYLGCLWPIATHMAPHELAIVLVPLGFAGGIVQLISGVICLRNQETMNGNILLAFSTFMFFGMGEFLLKGMNLMPQDTSAVDGWVFLIMGILMTGFTIGHLLVPKVAFLFMISTDMFFVPAGLFFITKQKMFWTVASWDLPVVVVLIIWLVLGTVLNKLFDRTIFPLGKPLVRLNPKPAPPAKAMATAAGR